MKAKHLGAIIGTVALCTCIIGLCIHNKQKNSDECPYKEFLVVDVFDSYANYQGIQSGWFAKIVKEKFNMQLNIIAPNVTGGGSTLFDMRSATGNLGDIIICTGQADKLQRLIDSQLLIDMSPYLKGKDIMRYSYSINALNKQFDQNKIYAIPSEISTQSPNTSSEGLELNYGAYIRWDYYKEAGYPEINTFEDLLPILQKMQKKHPTSETGVKTYAFSFFPDWDSNMLNAAKQPCSLYGYDASGLVLAKADGSDYQGILDENSLYLRMLHFFFEANQLGLVDPASPLQSYDDLYAKYQAGAILFSPWPWLGQNAYNTIQHTQEGKGYMLAPINDMQIYSYGCNPDGNQKIVIAIGSKAKDPKRLADFVNWLYSDEGIRIQCASGGNDASGPEGLTWENTQDGPILTDFGKEALFGNNPTVPDEYGGGYWNNGISMLNYKPVAAVETDSDGIPYYYGLWDSVLDMKNSALDTDWKTFMHADSSYDYLEKNKQIIISPGCSYEIPDSDSEISALREQCADVIVNYSWKLIYAEDEAHYNELLKKMKTIVKAIGYEKVRNHDIAAAKVKHEKQLQAIQEYNHTKQ